MDDTRLNGRPEKLAERRQGRPNAIPAQMYDSLFELVRQKLCSISVEEQEKVQAILEADRADRAIKNATSQSKRQFVQLTYSAAANLADQVGVELKDVIENMGIALNWPNEDAVEMADIFDSMDQHGLAQARKVIDALSPTFWRPTSLEYTSELVTPTKRMLYVVKNRVGWKKDASAFISSFHDEELDKVWGDRKCFTLASHKTVLMVGNALGISPGWLMMLADGKHRLLSATPEAEYLMAGYLFLGKVNRLIFKSYLSTIGEGNI